MSHLWVADQCRPRGHGCPCAAKAAPIREGGLAVGKAAGRSGRALIGGRVSRPGAERQSSPGFLRRGSGMRPCRKRSGSWHRDRHKRRPCRTSLEERVRRRFPLGRQLVPSGMAPRLGTMRPSGPPNAAEPARQRGRSRHQAEARSSAAFSRQDRTSSSGAICVRMACVSTMTPAWDARRSGRTPFHATSRPAHARTPWARRCRGSATSPGRQAEHPQ